MTSPSARKPCQIYYTSLHAKAQGYTDQFSPLQAQTFIVITDIA